MRSIKYLRRHQPTKHHKSRNKSTGEQTHPLWQYFQQNTLIMREESVEADGLQQSTQNRPANKSAPEKISAGAARVIQPCHSTIGLKMKPKLLNVPLYPLRNNDKKLKTSPKLPHFEALHLKIYHTYHEREER